MMSPINPFQILIEICNAWRLPFLSQELRQKWIKTLFNLKQVPSLTFRPRLLVTSKSLFVHSFIKISSDSWLPRIFEDLSFGRRLIAVLVISKCCLPFHWRQVFGLKHNKQRPIFWNPETSFTLCLKQTM